MLYKSTGARYKKRRDLLCISSIKNTRMFQQGKNLVALCANPVQKKICQDILSLKNDIF